MSADVTALPSNVAGPPLDHVVGLLSSFSDELTGAVDRILGTDWATNEEILAFTLVALSRETTTHHMSEASGLQRRSLSRFVGRLVEAGIFQTGTLARDRRRVTVSLTARGRREVRALGAELTTVLIAQIPVLRRIAFVLQKAGVRSTAGLGRLPADPIEMLEHIAGVGVTFAAKIEDLSPETKLSGRQRVALLKIAAKDRVRPGPLASSLHMTRAGAAYVVDQLVDMGFVQRKSGVLPEDMRAVVIEATPAGRRFTEVVAAATLSLQDPLFEVCGALVAWAEARQPDASPPRSPRQQV